MRQSGTGLWRRLGVRGWATLIIALATLAAFLAVTAVVALGILFVLLPAAVLATAIFLLFPSKSRRGRPQRPVKVIEGEFRVVDPGEKTAERPTADPPA